MKVSDCCGAAPSSINGDCDTSDFGICSDCREHCEYIEFCDECGEEIKDCECDEDIADEKMKEELENDAEITELLEQINKDYDNRKRTSASNRFFK